MQTKLARLVMATAVAATTSEGVNAQEFTGLEEVVVTASRRAETLQDAGMSVTALTGAELERAGIDNYLDFAVRIPNLGTAFEADGRFDSNSPSIRGVFGQNTTGFYIDDTPVPPTMMPRVMDVERVEVLRGPQGSLFGARSMGGTIRLITKQPDLQEFGGNIHTSLSTVEDGDENYQVDAAINLPVIEDVFAIRGSAYWGQNSGIFDRVYQPTWTNAVTGATEQNPGPDFGVNENIDDEEFWGVQLVGRWLINDRLAFIPKYMYQKIEADGMPFADIEPDVVVQPRFYNTEEPGSDEWTLLSGTLVWDLDGGEITSTTAWFERDTDETEEQETFIHALFNEIIGIPVDPLPGDINTRQEYEYFSHETRFSSDWQGAFQFIGGIFYQDTTSDRIYPPARIPGLNASVNAAVGAPIDIVPEDLIFETFEPLSTEEWAIFGELTYSFNERWTVTAGGRFFDTELEGAAFSDGFANDGPSVFEGDQSESGFNPRVLVEADFTDEVNVYASAGKGFRIGGVNGNLPLGLCGDELNELDISPDETPSFDSDELWSYELGVKSVFAGNRVSVNASVYFIDWTDIQQINRLACGFQFTQNAGEAESQGFEVELQAAPLPGLNLALGIGYTDAEITDSGGVPGVAAGDAVQGVPDWTGSASAEYLFPVGGGWDAVLRTSYNYYGDSISTNNTGSVADARERPSWWMWGLRAGIMNDNWELTLFGDNLGDERANLADNRSIAAETPGRPRIVTNRPRSYGLEARYRF